MKSLILALLICLGLVQLGSTKSASTGCVVNLGDGPTPVPIVLDAKGQYVFPQLKSDDRTITAAKGDAITLLCSGSKNSVDLTGNVYETVTCVKGSTFQLTTGEQHDFSEFACTKNPASYLQKTGTCVGPDGATITQATIGFQGAPGGFVPLITVCHDESIDATFSSAHRLPGMSITAKEHNPSRPSFSEGGLFPKINCNTAYKIKSELALFTKLFGSKLGPQYLTKNHSVFLSRGHLAPEGDFTFAAWQNSSFYYANAVPQWQCINAGNWLYLETSVRDKAEALNRVLQITSGAYQVLSLPDTNNNPIELYLAKDSTGTQRLPVPKWMWKVVHDTQTNTATAFVTLNNPHATSVTPDDLICEDVCDQVPWISKTIKSRTNLFKGYTYCCSVADLHKAVSYAPDLDLPLLV